MTKRSASKLPPVALIYMRVSTAKQASEGISLEAQLTKCSIHAERMGWKVFETFTDPGISGKEGVENRPALQRLLEQVRELRKQGQEAVVVVYSLSRLSRSQRLTWQLLDDRDGEGLAVSSASEAFDTSTPMGRAMLGMIAVWNTLETDQVSERTRDSLAYAKANGTQLGAKTMKQLNPETVELVKGLWATGRYTQRSLVEELNRRQIPTPSGKGAKWWIRTVQIALKD